MSGRTFGVQSSWDDVFRQLGLDVDPASLRKGIGVADSMNQQIEEFINRFVTTSLNDNGDITFDAAGTYTFDGDVVINGDLTSSSWVSETSGWKLFSDTGAVEFNDGTFRGSLEAGDIHIPDQTTAASFHVDSDGDVWVGTNIANKATAPFSIDSATGDVVMNEVNLTGSMLVSGGDISTNDGRLWVKNGGNGTPFVVVGDDSLLLTANGMNITSKFTPPIVFGSTDSAFTTENPKALAAIVGVASEAYGNDSDGGMYLEFVINGNNPGAANAVNSSSHGYLMQTSGFKPRNDNVADCGGASNRWDDVYATNGTIVTSDLREKTLLPDERLGLDFLLSLDGIAFTRTGGKRIHHGIAAQQVQAALGPDHAIWIEGDTGVLGVRHDELWGPQINANREIAERLERLEAAIMAS